MLQVSLQHMAMSKIAIQLWMGNDVISLVPIAKHPSLTAVVRQKVDNLLLPNQFKNELSKFIKPIGLQIYQWHAYNNDNNSIDLLPKNLKKIRWTSAGSIDEAKSARVLAQDPGLKLETRFQIARDFGLIEEIGSLWKELPGEKQARTLPQLIYDELLGVQQLDLISEYTFRINGTVVDWRRLTSRVKEGDDSTFYHTFHLAAGGKSSAAKAKYFFHLLSHREKQLIFSNGNSLNAKTVFLLDLMSENQRAEAFKTYPMRILKALLTWPYQHLVVESAHRMWEFISDDDFLTFLYDIINKIDFGYEHCPYRDVFRAFWKSSPDKFKRRFFNDEFDVWSFLWRLFAKGEEELRGFVLKDAKNEEIKKLMADEFYIAGRMREKMFDLRDFLKEEI